MKLVVVAEIRFKCCSACCSCRKRSVLALKRDFRGLLPPGVAITPPAAHAARQEQAVPRRDTQLFDAVWSSVIEGLGRNGQPERANKAFEHMLERLSADTAALALAEGRTAGWRARGARGADSASCRDARLFDSYLRAGLFSRAFFITQFQLIIFLRIQHHRRSFCSPMY
jgi:pentatricopeptide repeat protein